MFYSYFNIKYTNKVSKKGYKWKGEDVIPKIEGENISVNYTTQTFNDFKVLTKYYSDTKLLKSESLKFLNLWGRLEAQNSKPEYLSIMNAIHIYESLRKDIELKKQPNIQDYQKTGFLNLSYEWNPNKNKIVPTFYPDSLWHAIQLTFLLYEFNMNKKS